MSIIKYQKLPEEVYLYQKKYLFGTFSIDFYIEDRKTLNENSRYKHFLVVKFFYIKYTLTFRSQNIIDLYKNHTQV